jgi:hypothetical protein
MNEETFVKHRDIKQPAQPTRKFSGARFSIEVNGWYMTMKGKGINEVEVREELVSLKREHLTRDDLVELGRQLPHLLESFVDVKPL